MPWRGPLERGEPERAVALTFGKHHDGPYPCFFRCGALLRTKYDRGAISGWVWFTGFGKKTIHVCPMCAFQHAPEVREMMTKRGLTPPDELLYPEMPYPTINEPAGFL